jgi:hypothetical protein
MFLAAVTRKFNKKQNASDRFFVSLAAEAVVLVSIMVSCRCIFYLSTALPAPDRECVRGIRDWKKVDMSERQGLHHNPSCGDLIYSGHFNISFSFLTYWFTESHRFFRGESPMTKALRYLYGLLLVCVVCVQSYGILATRHHYTVDLVVVPFVDYFVRNGLLPKLGLSYNRLTDRGAVLHSHWKGFRLFGKSYENAQVDAGHNGPSPIWRKIGGVFVATALAIVAFVFALLASQLFGKLALLCPATPQDGVCQFFHENIKPVF